MAAWQELPIYAEKNFMVELLREGQSGKGSGPLAAMKGDMKLLSEVEAHLKLCL